LVALDTNNPQKGEWDYHFFHEFQSHEPEFDCLKSLEIEETIRMLEWVSVSSVGLYILATNGRKFGSLAPHVCVYVCVCVHVKPPTLTTHDDDDNSSRQDDQTAASELESGHRAAAAAETQRHGDPLSGCPKGRQNSGGDHQARVCKRASIPHQLHLFEQRPRVADIGRRPADQLVEFERQLRKLQ